LHKCKLNPKIEKNTLCFSHFTIKEGDKTKKGSPHLFVYVCLLLITLLLFIFIMTLIRSVKDYAKRHQQGLTMTAVVVGGTLLAGQYAAYKWREAQEEAAAERLAKEK
jgi:uncharacterized integral membrane protein